MANQVGLGRTPRNVGEDARTRRASLRSAEAHKLLVDGTTITLDEDGKLQASDSDGQTTDSSGYTIINTSKYTATPATTSTITMSDTSDMVAGLPLRYKYGGTTYYGIITSVTASTSIALAGATLDTGEGLTELAVGPANKTVVRRYVFGANYTTNLLLNDDMLDKGSAAFPDGQRDYWHLSNGYLVSYAAEHATAGAGTNKFNPHVDGTKVGTEDSGLGISLDSAAPLSLVTSGAVEIDTSEYKILYGNQIGIELTQRGNTSDDNLTFFMTFVLE